MGGCGPTADQRRAVHLRARRRRLGRHAVGGSAQRAQGAGRPDVAVQFPASYVGERLDRRAIPLRVANAGTIAKSLARGDAYFGSDDRADITAVLSGEAQSLARRSTYPETYQRIVSQEDAVQH